MTKLDLLTLQAPQQFLHRAKPDIRDLRRTLALRQELHQLQEVAHQLLAQLLVLAVLTIQLALLMPKVPRQFLLRAKLDILALQHTPAHHLGLLQLVEVVPQLLAQLLVSLVLMTKPVLLTLQAPRQFLRHAKRDTRLVALRCHLTLARQQVLRQ